VLPRAHSHNEGPTSKVEGKGRVEREGKGRRGGEERGGEDSLHLNRAASCLMLALKTTEWKFYNNCNIIYICHSMRHHWLH